jgi:ADP-ribosylglycohydrolase
MPSRAERIEGAILGLLVGDALGVPYEFHPSTHIPPIALIEFEPPPGFSRAHDGVPCGTYSDDGAHALCLLASLLHCGRLDPQNLAHRLVNWLEHGYLAVDGRVFDVGVQTQRALARIRAGVPAIDAGPAGPKENGNGALMRVLPLALWHRGSDGDLVKDARMQSRVTHGHVRSQLCCALYCLWARRTFEGASDAWAEAVATLREIVAGEGEACVELKHSIKPDEIEGGRGSGYVVDCLRSARGVQSSGGYEAVVKAAIALGDDTDTTASVAGGIAGLRDGVGAIPQRWRDALRGREIFEPLVKELIERCA